MASRIQPKDATLNTTGVACLVATMAWILIGSIYVNDPHGWAQFCLNAFSAVAVCAVGASALGYAAYQQYVAKRNLFADHEPSNEFDYRSTGQWAVVTGATDGIGKEYARQLAADYGMDLLLVGRNQDKLRTVAELIRKECGGHKRRVMTVVADFTEDPVTRVGHCYSVGMKNVSTDDRQENRGQDCRNQNGWNDEDQDDVGDWCFCDIVGGDEQLVIHRRCTRWYPRLRTVVEKCTSTGGIGVLINCAGVCYPYPEYFAGMIGNLDKVGDEPPVSERAFTTEFCDSADATIKCNMTAAVHVCRLVLPGMLTRGRGLVVNVGSASASVPAAPFMALYAATKKFLENLSADLDAECEYLTRDKDDGHGVRVQCARPAYVATAMLRLANPDIRVVSDDEGDDDERQPEVDVGGDQRCWWTVRRKSFENTVERWLVPSARQWVRSALRQGGRLYAGRSGTGRPSSFTGYWPHTLLVWCTRLASSLTPGRWFVYRVVVPFMLSYRAKRRYAILKKNKN